jgi:hypothetical protein
MSRLTTPAARLVVVWLALGALVGGMLTPHRVADSSTYVMMADSLVHDGDLAYEARDLARARALQFEDLPSGLFLIRRGEAYAYGKPIPYPLFAAPWFALFGLRGFLALNGFLLAGILLLVADVISRAVGRPWGSYAALALVGFSVVPAYVYWIDPFLFLTFCTAAAVVSFQRRRPILCGLLIAIAAGCRPPYLLLAFAPLALWASQRRWVEPLRFTIAGVVTSVALLLATRAATGQWAAYFGDRYYFMMTFPFEPWFDLTQAKHTHFSDALAYLHYVKAADLAQSAFYFLFGRFTGLLLYFPTLFACLLWSGRWNREKSAWTLAGLLCCAALILAQPRNYSGGSGALGNRDFVLLPLAAVMIDRVTRPRLRALASLPLVLLVVPVALAPLYYTVNPGMQGVACPYRLFPMEWNQAPFVALPIRFPGIAALTANQYGWEGDAFWTVGGKKADFVLWRTRPEGPRIRLWALNSDAQIYDGDSLVDVHVGPDAEREIELTHPVVQFADSTDPKLTLSVYRLRVDSHSGVRATSRGTPRDNRVFGVYVRVVEEDTGSDEQQS